MVNRSPDSAQPLRHGKPCKSDESLAAQFSPE